MPTAGRSHLLERGVPGALRGAVAAAVAGSLAAAVPLQSSEPRVPPLLRMAPQQAQHSSLTRERMATTPTAHGATHHAPRHLGAGSRAPVNQRCTEGKLHRLPRPCALVFCARSGRARGRVVPCSARQQRHGAAGEPKSLGGGCFGAVSNDGRSFPLTWTLSTDRPSPADERDTSLKPARMQSSRSLRLPRDTSATPPPPCPAAEAPYSALGLGRAGV